MLDELNVNKYSKVLFKTRVRTSVIRPIYKKSEAKMAELTSNSSESCEQF
jgi:hypothetical protein